MESPISLSEEKVKSIYADAKAYLIGRWEPRPGYEEPIVLRAEGAYFWDARGKRYLDFISQLYNVHLGMGNKKVIEAVKKQLDELVYVSPSYLTLPKIELAKRLAKITPGDLCKSFFGSSGAEANETAIKLAQLYTGKKKIIGFWDAYHGSTYATVSAGGSARNRNFPSLSIFEEFKHIPSPDCYRCPFGKQYPECDLTCAHFLQYTIEKEGEKSVAAFMAEPINSWAGQIVPPKEYWPMVRRICDEKGVLLIFDEVMTGFARTGKMFACEHWNVVPDIETYAKGITSAYVPLGATIVNKKMADYFDEKGLPHSYTYSGPPLACAAALATIDYYLEENLAERTAKMGGYLMEGLREIQDRCGTIGDIRGKGLFIGVELVANRETKEKIVPAGLAPPDSNNPEKNPMVNLTDTCRQKGLIIGSSPGTGILRMMPCLTIEKEQIDVGLKTLEEAVQAMEKKFELPKKK